MNFGNQNFNNMNALQQENENLKKQIEKLKKRIKLLELAINGDTETINQLKSFGYNTKNLEKNNNLIQTGENNQIKVDNNVYSQTNFMDFYDVIIDIKSIKDINKGWEIKMSEEGLKKYKEYKEEKVIKIGVIGNSNKGKSFILSKISKIKLPSGTSIRTEGLSVKYPELEEFKDRKIVLLDSAGLEMPVLKDNKENFKDKTKNEIFKEKSREKLITELFLQNYIINNSDILLTVVGILTYSEQKLLNRIKTEIQRAKINKPLYIIHNLITYTTKEQVEDYIKKYLKESATFDLEDGHKISTKVNEEKGMYYYEKNCNPKIYHLIFANEGSEAGKYYNEYTLKFLEQSFINVTDLKSFDIIQTIKERFVEISKEIIEKNEKQKPLNLDDFSKDEKDNKLIKLNEHNDFTLKKCLIDELGFSNLKANGFEPTYSLYKPKDEDKMIVKLEVPGNSTIKSKIDYVGEYTIIRLTGTKDKDKLPEDIKDNIHITREFGKFSIDIPLKTEDYKFQNQKPEIKDKKGLLILEYSLEPKQVDDDEEYKVGDAC